MTLKYKMKNESNGVTITTNINYLPDWLARGFDIVEITIEDNNDMESSSSEEEMSTN